MSLQTLTLSCGVMSLQILKLVFGGDVASYTYTWLGVMSLQSLTLRCGDVASDTYTWLWGDVASDS